MGRAYLPLFQINQYHNRNQNKAVSRLKGVFRLGAALFDLLPVFSTLSCYKAT